MDETQERSTGVAKNKSDDFLVLENDAIERSDTKPNVITQIIIKESSCETEFMEKIWTSFLTFHVFIIPAFLSLLLGCVPVFGGVGYDNEYEIAKQHLMVGLMGAAVIIGLPFHLLALADLEDLINESRADTLYSNSSTQTNEHSVTEQSDDETDVVALPESD